MKVGDLVTMPGSNDPGIGLVLEDPCRVRSKDTPKKVRVLWLDEEEFCSEPVAWLKVMKDNGDDK